MAFAFAGLAVSCSNDDNVSGKSETTGPFDLKVKVQVAPATRASGQAVNDKATSELNTVSLFLLKSTVASDKTPIPANLVVDREIVLNSAEIALLKKSQYIITDVEDDILSIAIVANGLNEAEIGEGTPLSSIEAIRMNGQFVNIQPTEANPGVSNSPMYAYSDAGFIEIEAGVGQNVKQASATLIAQVARIQVYGKINTDMEDFKLTRIFLDNFITTNNAEKPKFEVGQNIETALADLLAPYNKIFDYNAEGLKTFDTKTDGVYAYHIFPQESSEVAVDKDRNVKLVLEMNYADDRLSPIKYATLMLTSQKESGLEGMNMDGGTIYTIDLGTIAWDGKTPGGPLDPGDGTEKPNMGDNATVEVTIQEWNEVATIPAN